MKSVIGSQAGANDQASFARSVLRAVPVSARGVVVNRTHRVVRERAKAMQDKRRRERSLMAPLVICAVLLILSILAVWTGLYQYQAVEAMQADVASLATTDLNNHTLVALLWFVPVSLALLATFLVRRSRKNSEDEPR
jgi:cytochrome bd-type quinol oxidase subunit 2